MTSYRHAAIHLALIALVLRAFLPAGWMPNPAAGDGAPFVICTMEGAVQAPDGKTKPATNDPRAHETCPFAAAAPLAPPQQDINFAVPVFAAAMAATPAHPAVDVVGAPFAPQSPRAPPLNA